MTRGGVERSVSERVARAAIDLIPQWYSAEFGPQSHILRVGQYALPFKSHRKLTPKLVDLKQGMEARLPALVELFAKSDPPSLVDLVQEDFATRWLTTAASFVNWKRLIEYARGVVERTYENAAVQKTLVLRPHAVGTLDIADPAHQKAFDPVATSQWTYLEATGDLLLSGYGEATWDDLKAPTDYHLHPYFLLPLVSRLGAGDVAVVITTRRDVVILNKDDLIASKRRGRWRVYDSPTFKNALVDIVGTYAIGANLFPVLFDLSYRRHGALLIFDPGHHVLKQVVNPASIVQNKDRGALATVCGACDTIYIDHSKKFIAQRRRFLELAGVDGALIFDSKRVTAVGAMIRTHESVRRGYGARTVAALSAYRYGGVPLKVSADGEVVVHFKSGSGDKRECEAALAFA